MACQPVGFFGSCCPVPPPAEPSSITMWNYVAAGKVYLGELTDGPSQWTAASDNAWSTYSSNASTASNWLPGVLSPGSRTSRQPAVDKDPTPPSNLWETSVSSACNTQSKGQIRGTINSGQVADMAQFHGGSTTTFSDVDDVKCGVNMQLCMTTSATIGSACTIFTWPLAFPNSMQSQHGVATFKLYYKLLSVGAIVEDPDYVPNYDSIRTLMTYGLRSGLTCRGSGGYDPGSSHKSSYGFVSSGDPSGGDPALAALAALTDVLAGNDTTDQTLTTTQDNSSYTTTHTQGTAIPQASGKDTFYLCVRPDPLVMTSSPFPAHHGIDPKAYIYPWGFGQFHLEASYTWGISTQPKWCALNKIDVQSAVPAVLRTYELLVN